MNGVNNDAVGEIVRFAVNNIEKVRSVLLQPIMFTGRDANVGGDERRSRRYTLADLARDLQHQTSGVQWEPMRDWFPMSAYSVVGNLFDHLNPTASVGSMFADAHPSQAIFSPLLVNQRTRQVVPIASFVNVETGRPGAHHRPQPRACVDQGSAPTRDSQELRRQEGAGRLRPPTWRASSSASYRDLGVMLRIGTPGTARTPVAVADGRWDVVPRPLQLRPRRDRDGSSTESARFGEKSRSALTPAGWRQCSIGLTRLFRSPTGTRRTADIASTRTEPSCRCGSSPPNVIPQVLRGRKPLCRGRVVDRRSRGTVRPSFASELLADLPDELAALLDWFDTEADQATLAKDVRVCRRTADRVAIGPGDHSRVA